MPTGQAKYAVLRARVVSAVFDETEACAARAGLTLSNYLREAVTEKNARSVQDAS